MNYWLNKRREKTIRNELFELLKGIYSCPDDVTSKYNEVKEDFWKSYPDVVNIRIIFYFEYFDKCELKNIFINFK